MVQSLKQSKDELSEYANTLEQKVAEQTSELRQSLEELKSTQAQLIQSEKMASLGELTAGIAHEIQNPLNFVNNFSEVNTELIDEMEEEMTKEILQMKKYIAKDIKENEGKDKSSWQTGRCHCKRNAATSRSSSGKKNQQILMLCQMNI